MKGSCEQNCYLSSVINHYVFFSKYSRRTNDLAKEKGCSHVYIFATSVYSQHIFKSLNFQVLRELDYETYKDKNGSEFFKGMQEHKSAQIVVFDLKTPNSPCSK